MPRVPFRTRADLRYGAGRAGRGDTSVFSKLLRCVIARDVAGCIGVLEEIVLQGRDMSQFVSDFTWYLRNLLLVKTSGDSCEEVIDISSENLARLKEEAQQIEVDAIMRDIRCFSGAVRQDSLCGSETCPD